MTRTVVITGGGSGIGRAIAAAFAGTDCRVFVTGRRREPLEQTATALGRRVVPVVCDSCDLEQVEALAHAVGDEVDVLVNNAGGNREFDLPAADGDLSALEQQWRANLESNLLGPALTTAALEKSLQPGGAVISIGSFAADRGAGSYGAAKAGLASWNIHLARRLGPRDLTANVVAPGYIAETGFFSGRDTPGFQEARVAETATGRAGQPGDVAGLVHFLSTPAARHITGQVLHVNGGALTTR